MNVRSTVQSRYSVNERECRPQAADEPDGARYPLQGSGEAPASCRTPIVLGFGGVVSPVLRQRMKKLPESEGAVWNN
jgi:hypothetical protein